MTSSDAQDPHFEARVRASFARQNLNRTIGASLTSVAPGEVAIELPFRDDLSQQHGFLHGGVVAAIVDAACGYAALPLTPAGSEVLTVEFKINYVAPADGERLIARGRVTRAGRTVTVCAGDVFVVSGGRETLVATMLATIMRVGGEREGSPPHRRERAGHAPDATARTQRRPWCICGGRGVRRRFDD